MRHPPATSTRPDRRVSTWVVDDGTEYTFVHQLSARQVSMVLASGLIREIADEA